MPFAAKKPCGQIGCRVLVERGQRYCSEHERPAWQKTKPVKRITGRRLQAMRARLFARDPLCVECRALGVSRPATQRDHIIPLAEGGADDESNEQGLCNEHHEAKTERESVRGRGRSKV
jgi:5-methylcytosine-specific restriction protein A